MSAGHDHGSVAGAQRAGAAYKRRLVLALGLIGGFFLVELVGGLLSNSLALLSDAGHMFTDVLGLSMALAAIQAASGGRTNPQRSFGLYRLEILAALANAVLLFGVAGFIVYEGVQRLGEPPEVLGAPMLVIGVLGLVVNVVVFFLLRQGAKESLNVEGAYLEVLADMLGSVAVVVAAIVTSTTGWAFIDPLFGLGIGLFVIPRTWRLARKALRVLIQAAPPDVDLAALQTQLAALDGVASVHDLHVWTLTSGMEVGSVHLRLEPGRHGRAILEQARRVLADDHGIAHATVQIELAEDVACGACETLAW